MTIVTAVLLSAAGLAQESQNPPNQATPDQPSPGQVNPTQTSPAPTSPSQSQPDRSQPDQRQSGQTPPPDQSKPEPPIAAVATQAENAAIKSVQVFNLLEKKSVVFPDIASTTAALGTGAKFQLFVDNSISVHSIAWSALGSLIGQADDSPTGYGVSGSGYAKRFGSSLARESSGEFFGTFVIASALHQDPRFFPEYNPTLKHAMKYSLNRLFVTRNDAGQKVANTPGLLGPLLGESLANVYWPDRNRTVGDTLFRYGLDLASRAAGNMFREYWPVVAAKMRHEPPKAGAPH
ncbi:MAG: hypothetical protein WBS24_07615 [Terriglobales bacterium]